MHIRKSGTAFLFFVSVALSAGAQNPLLLPVKTDGRWGYCDTTGTLRISLRFESAGMFLPNGLAPVKMDGSVYLIDRSGEIVTKDRCRDVQVINTGLYACYNGSEWKFHGPGLTVVPPPSVQALQLIFGRWVYYTPSGAGMMDSRLQPLLEPVYDQIQASGEPGFFLLYNDSLTGVADTAGNVLLPPSYPDIRFRRPGFVQFHSSGKSGLVTLSGNIRTDTLYDDIQTDRNNPFILLFNDSIVTACHIRTGKQRVCDDLTRVQFRDRDYLIACLPDGINLLDSNLQFVFAKNYESIQREPEGFIVRKNGLFGFCDTMGNEVHPTRYSYITPFAMGSAITGADGLRGAIHCSGTVLAEPLYDKVEIFTETAKLYRNETVTVVDFDEKGKVWDRTAFKNFKTVTIGGFRDALKPNPNQTSATPPPTVWFFDPNLRKWGLNSPEGDELLAPQFDYIHRLGNGLTRVGMRRRGDVWIDETALRYQSVWGLVNNRTGQIIIRPEYIDIRRDSLSPDTQGRFLLTDTQLHFFILDTAVGKPYGPFTWLGNTCGEGRPVAEGGRWKLHNPDTAYTHKGTLQDFLETRFSPGTFTGNRQGNYSGRLVLEGGIHYQWSDHKKPQTATYRFLSDFVEGFAIMSPIGSEQFGVVRCDGTVTVNPEYDRIEIIRTEHSVFFLKYNKRQTYGFIKDNGNWAFEQKFPQEGRFSEGLAFMGYDDSKGTICVDTGGRVMFLPNVTRATRFSEGLAAVRGKRHWYFMDKNMDTAVFDKSWSRVGEFHGGLAPAYTLKGYRYINTRGEPATKHLYRDAKNYRENRALVNKNGRWGLIDAQGSFIIRPHYQQAKYLPHDSLYAMAGRQGWHLYRSDGSKLSHRPLQQYKPFTEGHCLVMLPNGVRTVMHRDGTLEKPPRGMLVQSVQGQFVTMFPEASGKTELADSKLRLLKLSGIRPGAEPTAFKYGSEGIIFARIRCGGWIGVDRTGKHLFDVHGTPVSGFSEGYAIVRLPDGRFIYINVNGEQVFGEFFQSAKPFSGGKAYVSQDKGKGVLDRAGNFIIPPKYRYIGPFSEGFAAVQMESTISISDCQDRPIVNGLYDSVILDPCGYFRVESADKVGWIARNGRIVWNPAR